MKCVTPWVLRLIQIICIHESWYIKAITMLLPTPMQFATLYVLREDASEAALALAQTSAFEPAINKISDDVLPELPGEVFRERFRSASNRLGKLLELYAIDFNQFYEKPAPAVTEHALIQLDSWLGDVWGVLSKHQETLRYREEEI